MDLGLFCWFWLHLGLFRGFGCFKSIRNLISLKVCVQFLGGSGVWKFEFLTQVHGSVMLKFIGEDGVCIVFWAHSNTILDVMMCKKLEMF